MRRLPGQKTLAQNQANCHELWPILGNFGLKNWRFLTRAPARPRGAKGKKQQQKLTRQQLELQLAEEEVRIPNHFDFLTSKIDFHLGVFELILAYL